ncbi:hypothetical protein ACJZ2D_011259 [Fusarium nematophilum]
MSKQVLAWCIAVSWCFGLIPHVAGQDTGLPGLIEMVPDCAQSCFAQGILDANCTITPISALSDCICSNTTLQANLSACLQTSCSFQDRSAVVSTSNQLCDGYPVESRRHQLMSTAISCATITFSIVILRCVARLMVTSRLWWDDWTAIFAMVGVPGSPNRSAGTRLGFGHHFWNIKRENIRPIFQTLYAFQILYIFIQVSAKGSLLAFYSRVFTSRHFQIAAWATAAFLIGHGLIFLGLVVFQCHPIERVWTRSVEGSCLNLGAIGYAGAVAAIIEDIVIFILPIPELLKLQLSRRKKAALLFMFSIGSFACVTTMVRLKYLVSLANTGDATWDNVYISIWSIIELSVALICASLPALRPLIQMIPGAISTVRDSTFGNSTDSSRPGSMWKQKVVFRPGYQSWRSKELPPLPLAVVRESKSKETEKHRRVGDAYLNLDSSSMGETFELDTVTRERTIF